MPPPTVSALRATLLAFARSGTPLPPSFAGDAATIAAGTKQLLGDADLLSFTCTGCGACCRGMSDSVLLDPLDVARASHALRAPLPPSHTAPGVGCWSVDALPVGSHLPTLLSSRMHHPPSAAWLSGEADAALKAGVTRGLAPLLFLKSVPVEGGGRQCPFAVPGPHTPHPGGGTAATTLPGLRCSLGREGQPLACALYPLGDLWSWAPTPYSPSTDRTHYYTLDAARCEGVSPAAPPRTVAAYRDANGLPARRAAGEWFVTLATAAAVVLSAQAPSAADAPITRLAAAEDRLAVAVAGATTGGRSSSHKGGRGGTERVARLLADAGLPPPLAPVVGEVAPADDLLRAALSTAWAPSVTGEFDFTSGGAWAELAARVEARTVHVVRAGVATASALDAASFVLEQNGVNGTPNERALGDALLGVQRWAGGVVTAALRE